MAFYPQYPGYQPGPYYPQPVPDQLAQLRQQQMQQMQPQMIQQPVQPAVQPSAQQNGGINWVGSKLEADNWPIAPGCAVALWDSNNPVIYLRQADSTGISISKTSLYLVPLSIQRLCLRFFHHYFHQSHPGAQSQRVRHFGFGVCKYWQ